MGRVGPDCVTYHFDNFIDLVVFEGDLDFYAFGEQTDIIDIGTAMLGAETLGFDHSKTGHIGFSEHAL